MNRSSRAEPQSHRRGLWRRTLVLAVVAVVATVVVGGGLARLVGTAAALRWGTLAIATLVGVFGRLVAGFDDNRPPEADAMPADWFGLPNLVTLARGVLLAWVAGFILLAWTERGVLLAWLPALLYGLAAALDAVDGALARRLGRTTALGERLDVAFDAAGLLVAPVVAMAAGQLPWWYLTVGLARYAFVAAVRLREHRALPVADLPPRTSRRLLAGLQMAFVAAALTPVVSPALGRWGAALFGGALLLGFGRDWLYVSGRLVDEARDGDAGSDSGERTVD
ncbi:CDP-diacylglycerol--glycerol-3-phosphate 3-phosphatidyltransferase [Halogranum amylolyticum]|uniref:CDP-diacylglycerol--glycerol-3-phosphate 3-phosphatidyltransferase n=1 Tax=Halogranum amylolyticum TaxID=660520 RepID=A0A1H8U3N1_9EURY|nr:CDP-alcohol phosphatidyltransferase family protein [Halogranum amylolyticum]SEO97735.1 CDP-diacylglycerol--glycerol-3-phosphate 3-phosphatidyltransferase [Halogranum amylolyticum]